MELTQAQRIAKRRQEIDVVVYEEWLLSMGYKRVPEFWERYY
jgi:hypothetical protein